MAKLGAKGGLRLTVEIPSMTDDDDDKDNSDAEQRKFREPAIDSVMAVPNLFIGNLAGAQSLERLSEKDIALVISFEMLVAKCRHEGIDYHAYAIDDQGDYDIKQYFDEVVAKIDVARLAQKNVLVHCLAGVSRSATIVILYMMLQDPSLTYVQAHMRLKETRPCVNPNSGFTRQICEYIVKQRGGTYDEVFGNTREYISKEEMLSEPTPALAVTRKRKHDEAFPVHSPRAKVVPSPFPALVSDQEDEADIIPTTKRAAGPRSKGFG